MNNETPQTKVANRWVALCIAVTMASVIGYGTLQSDRLTEQACRQDSSAASLKAVQLELQELRRITMNSSAQIAGVQDGVNLVLKQEALTINKDPEYRKDVLRALGCSPIYPPP